ncbi:hypothetical protein ECVG_05222 [Escherichia coli H386]|uniref:Uncharacterized protein n=2 Tax=Escherichia coli TaxID=562 RepID=A0A1X3J8U4_ECOLX|nr:hypothetical protein ECVG_05222 [Escherichia coli H386]
MGLLSGGSVSLQEDLTMTIDLELKEDEAAALAQFVKRVSWSTLREHAVSDDEAYMMKDAIDALQRSLAASGYSPR